MFVDQIEFIHSIQSTSSKRMNIHESEVLNKSELKAYRAIAGQLKWAAESTRPNLAIDVRHLAT